MKTLFPELKPSNKPSVVWLQDIADDKTNTKIEGTIFQNENIGLAMKRFNCFKVNVQDMPEGELKKKYMKQIGFHFFDPAADVFGRPLVGKRASSLSGFSGAVDRVWAKSFTMRLKQYQKEMKNILDELDKIDSKKQVLDRKRQKLEGKPNPSLARAIEKDEAVLAKRMEEVEETESGINERCALKADFLPEGEGESAQKD